MMTLLLALAAPRAFAADTYIYYNSAYITASDVAPLQGSLLAAGASITTTTSSAWPTSWTGYKLVILLLPGSSFSATQVSGLRNMVDGGGRLVMSGDWGGASSWGSANSYVNSLNSSLGTGMSLNYSTFGSGCATTTAITSDQVTDAVTELEFAATNTLSGGTTLVRSSLYSLLAVSQTSTAPSSRTPYDVVLSGDVNLFLNSCGASTIYGHNTTLWENLYLGLCADGDGDGYDDEACGGDDCDDSNIRVHPGMAETTADSIDQDCDGVDACYTDNDGDNYGTTPIIDGSSLDCASGRGAAVATDCDDTDSTVHPGASEVVADSIDQDCDSVDSCYTDDDGDNYGTTVVIDGSSLNCTTGRGAPFSTDCDDTDASIHGGSTEIPYDGIDNDCVDGDLTDVDGDGFDCACVSGGTDCDDGDAGVHPGATESADGVDEDCDGTVDEVTDWYDDDGDGWSEAGGDCDDSDSGTHSGATEVCNGQDDDCDGTIDEGTECYDDDGDGWSEYEGDCSDGDADANPGERETDGNGVDDDCDGVVDDGSFDEDGDGYTSWAGDCDDTDAAVYPGAPELPDGKDNDCDGDTDEGTTTYDDDGDGYSEAGGDCDDTDPNASPVTSEVEANGVDDDCDGLLDEGGSGTDDDGDGLSEDQGDCDDADASVSPAADEVDGNSADDDCDGLVDEGGEDLDRDGYSTDAGDCDDANGWVSPVATEMCDAVDNDCDGEIDEGCDIVQADTGEETKNQGCGCATGDVQLGWVGLLAVGVGLGRRRR